MSPSQLRPQSSRKEADAGKRGRFLRRARVAGGGVGASRRGGGEVVARKEKVVLPCGHGDVEVAREEHLPRVGRRSTEKKVRHRPSSSSSAAAMAGSG
jgi:hypothetical protein